MSITGIACLKKKTRGTGMTVSRFLNENGGKEQPCLPAKSYLLDVSISFMQEMLTMLMMLVIGY